MSAGGANKPSLLRRLSGARVTRVRAAVLLLTVFGLFHLLGWRDDTAIISGTFDDHNARLTAIKGVLYAASYFAAVVVSPIMILAAAADLALSRTLRRPSDRRAGGS